MTTETKIAKVILKDGNVISHETTCGIDYYQVELDGEKYLITMENDECIFFLREVH